MTELQKTDIVTLLNRYIENEGSQARASKKLDASEATLINMRRGVWESISDDMWRKVGKQVGYTPNKDKWNIVQTQDFLTLVTLFDNAKIYGSTYAICAAAGAGKTAASRWFRENHSNVYHIQCAEYWTKKDFLGNILEKMGKDASGSITERVELICETIIKQDCPLLILDEADKLSDGVMYFFITLYNMLNEKCGLVMIATDFLSKRILKGRKLNKKGYNEIYSRLGRRFINLPGLRPDEVVAICQANGVADPTLHTLIYNECEGDLRRVERAVHKEKSKKAVKNKYATLTE
jgi:hypothetical protein